MREQGDGGTGGQGRQELTRTSLHLPARLTVLAFTTPPTPNKHLETSWGECQQSSPFCQVTCHGVTVPRTQDVRGQDGHQEETTGAERPLPVSRAPGQRTHLGLGTAVSGVTTTQFC